MIELKEILIKAGMCQKVSSMWDDKSSVEDIFNVACTLDGIDFITASKALDLPTIKRVFKDFINKPYQHTTTGEKAAILVDYTGDFNVPNNTSVISIMGRSICRLKMDDVSTCFINVADSSFVEIEANSGVLYRIRVHDRSCVSTLRLNSGCSLLVYKYGDSASFRNLIDSAFITVRQKNKLQIKDLY
jgi:hypothetical protein